MQGLTVIIFDEAGFEAFQFVARDDCLRLNINVALKSARNWNENKESNLTQCFKELFTFMYIVFFVNLKWLLLNPSFFNSIVYLGTQFHGNFHRLDFQNWAKFINFENCKQNRSKF